MALAVSSVSAMPLSRKSDPVLLTVDGKPTTLAEFKYFYEKNNSDNSSAISPEEYLEYFINFRLKVTEAENSGLDTTETFRREYDHFRSELAAPYFIDSTLLRQMIAEEYSHNAEEVNVSHIMLGIKPDDYSNLKNFLADIKSGKEKFEDVAARISIDPNSASKGGNIGWIPSGIYPFIFEEVAYNTPVDSISEPFNSGFGYHIIKVNGRRPAKGEIHARHILKMIRKDNKEDRATALRGIDSLYSLILNGADFAEIARSASDDKASGRNGGDLGWFHSGMMVQPFDSISFALADMEISAPFETRFGYHIVQTLARRNNLPLDSIRPRIEKRIHSDARINAIRSSKLKELRNKYPEIEGSDSALVEYHINEICKIDPQFAWQLKEYHDGLLLFESSNENVWKRAGADTLGLEKFFNDHRDKYSWDSPRYKALLIYTSSAEDSITASRILSDISPEMPDTEVAKTLRKALENRVRIERLLLAQGENPIADYLAFGSKKPEFKKPWTSVIPFRANLMQNPESASDVRGTVIADRQNELENEWLKSLRSKYKVKVNRKVLKLVPDLKHQ